MLTIATYWIAASYVIGIGLAVDQLRRPLSAWEAAGRERRFWLALSLILGFHALGEFAAIAYFAAVVPRFRGAGRSGPRQALERLNAALHRRGREATKVRGRRTAAEELALVAAVLVFASSFIHSNMIASHFEEYWLFGVFFAVVTCLQAIWTVLIFQHPGNRRVLVAGAVGTAAIIAVWLISRTSGLPFGPHPGVPEAVGVVDVVSTLDEAAALVLLLGALHLQRPGGVQLRLAAMVGGCLFLFSVLAGFGGHGH
jgi:hypothetical protein